jgi:ring-1,2-phenylacetyl-CoA epoxidase subunit PaaD
MGIVRDVLQEDDKVVVIITPTYSGCPAMKLIETNIGIHLKKSGFEHVKINTVLSPPWTTDWITAEARQKLKEYGIAPPPKVSQDKNALLFEAGLPVNCPFCNEEDTELKSQFGSTPCKSLYFCNSCQQPFEHFKCH